MPTYATAVCRRTSKGIIRVIAVTTVFETFGRTCLRMTCQSLAPAFFADLVTVLVVHVFVLEFVFNVPASARWASRR